MAVRVLFIGEIVGKAGIFCVKKLLQGIREERRIDFVIAECEGATGGFGIGKNHSIYLHKLGIDLLTSGEKIYYKIDMVPHIQTAPYILRPANYPAGNPGRGWKINKLGDFRLAVVNLLGQSGFERVHLSNPYTFLPDIVERIKHETDGIIVDFHASTTAEKSTMFHMADGTVSAIIGTHTKVMTRDEKIMRGGTAVITDIGRTGSLDSVGGLDPEIEIRKFLTAVPERSLDAWTSPALQGVILEIGADGRAVSIDRLTVPCGEIMENDGNGDG